MTAASTTPAGTARHPVWPALISLVGALGLPMARGGNIVEVFYVVPMMVLAALLIAIWLIYDRKIWWAAVMNCAVLLGVLLLATITSPYPTLALGALAPWLVLALLFCSDLRVAQAGPWMVRLFTLANLVVIVVGALVLAGNHAAVEFLTDNYSAYYPDLVHNMLFWRKPVFTFGTHSLAAFFYYCFFHMSLRAYKATGRTGYLILACADICLGIAVRSFTAFFFMGIALIRLVVEVRERVKVVALSLLVFLTIVVVVAKTSGDVPIGTLFDVALNNQGGGLSARYAQGGSLSNTIVYVIEHPLRPIGVSWSSSVFFGDSGPIEYLLRGSIPLLLAVYLGLWLFLRRNLRHATDRWHLFGGILAFELGFTILGSPRFLLILPAMVWYLNALPDDIRKAPHRPPLSP